MKLCVNGDWLGDAEDKVTLSALKDMVKGAENDYPNADIEISLEGHYDYWESYSALFNGESYEPTDFFIDVVLYKKQNSSIKNKV